MKALVRPVIDQKPPLEWKEVELELTDETFGFELRGETIHGFLFYRANPSEVVWDCSKRRRVTSSAYEFKIDGNRGISPYGFETETIYGTFTLSDLSFAMPEPFNPEELLQLDRELSEMHMEAA
jgi:hypothetical protein